MYGYAAEINLTAEGIAWSVTVVSYSLYSLR